MSLNPPRSHQDSCVGDGHGLFDGRRVMGADFAADAILERSHDLAARGVVLRIGAEDQGHVQRQANREAFDLHIAFLHDVEQSDLDFSGKVGQFVDGKDATVGAGQKAVVNHQLASEFVAAARRLDRVDVSDQIGDGHVRSCELLHIALVALHPGNRSAIAFARQQVFAAAAERRVGIVADLAAGNVGRLLIEQRE